MNLSLLAIAVQAAQNVGPINREGHYAVIRGFRDTPLAVFVNKNGEITEVFHPYSRDWLATEKHRMSTYNVLAEFNPDEDLEPSP